MKIIIPFYGIVVVVQIAIVVAGSATLYEVIWSKQEFTFAIGIAKYSIEVN